MAEMIFHIHHNIPYPVSGNHNCPISGEISLGSDSTKIEKRNKVVYPDYSPPVLMMWKFVSLNLKTKQRRNNKLDVQF